MAVTVTKRPDQAITKYVASKLQTPGLDNTLLFMGLTASAGTRSMSLLSSSPRNGSSPYVLLSSLQTAQRL